MTLCKLTLPQLWADKGSDTKLPDERYSSQSVGLPL
eukprot:COSAG02_NODE_6168_length_3753_cov_45.738318_4_plen_36_part_00